MSTSDTPRKKARCIGTGRLANKGRCTGRGCGRRFRDVKMRDVVPTHYVSVEVAGGQ